MEFLKKTKKTITEYGMLSTGDHVLIGLSGGPDSVCLAYMLDLLRDEFGLTLSAVYVNHCLRPDEVEREAAFCSQFCSGRSITFYERTVDVRTQTEVTGSNIQESARDLRYQCFEAVAAEIGAAKIALGHNADDQAETVLIRLIRASGRRGLSGIPPVRGRIIRPLIGSEREEILDFLSGMADTVQGQQYVLDTSNLKQEYLRNWVRLSLLTEIKKRNPAVVQDICRTAAIVREEDEYLELEVTKTLMRLISRKSDSSLELFVNPLGMLQKPLLRRVLRRAIEASRNLRGIGFAHIEDMIRLVKHGKSGDRIHLPGNLRAVKEYALLKITCEPVVSIGEYAVRPPCELTIQETGAVLKATMEDRTADTADERLSVVLDAGRLVLPLTVRARAEGDFFYPRGFGKKKKLQDFFVDEKVPRDERDRIPVVLSGNDIIWIAGYRADERFTVTEKTEKVLKLTLTKRSAVSDQR